ncbi:MAG TPA: hypothetical protein GXX40_00840 [Firmicutes bacterium]|nr:hypothetical protein [Bacillota bacterium]
MRSLRIGFAGTAKNTGKTTTLSALMDSFLEDGWRLGLTSIGYDGENLDNVTGLPKPRIYVQPGVLVATSTRCVEASSAKLRLVRETDINTSLGPVIIGKVEEPGLVVLAGPSYSKGLESVLLLFEEEGVRVSFIDGAFGRIAPMNVADGLVLCTGAARDRRVSVIAEEARGVERILKLNSWSGSPDAVLPQGSLIGEYPDEGLLPVRLPPRGAVLVEGAVSPAALNLFLSSHRELLDGGTVVFENPVSLIAGGAAAENERLIRQFHSVKFCVLKRLELFGVTVNPFYPERGRVEGTFEARYIDAVKLLDVFRRNLETLVLDVKREGIGALYQQVLAYLRNWEPQACRQLYRKCTS